MIGYFIIISDTGAGIIAIGSLSFFLSVASDLQQAIKNLGSSFNGVIQSSKYFDNLLQFEKQNADAMHSDGHINIPNTIESIEFRKVSFTYPNSEKETLKDISFTLRCPQSTVLVGENGAGKTTIIKLILGFYKPTSGEILINGVNIKEYPPEEYLKLFSVCFQDYISFLLAVSFKCVGYIVINYLLCAGFFSSGFFWQKELGIQHIKNTFAKKDWILFHIIIVYWGIQRKQDIQHNTFIYQYVLYEFVDVLF